MSISNCSFSMQPMHNQAHQLTIEFQNEFQSVVSSKQFIFRKLNDEEMMKQDGLSIDILLDVCSQNGTCSSTIFKSLFTKRDVQDTEEILKITNVIFPNTPKFFVLDLKGKEKKYLDPSIESCESKVLAFFKNEKAISPSNTYAKTMHALFKNKLDYIFNEGSLKSALLTKNMFEEHQITHLQETKQGVQDFCQIAEFILCSFKSGYEMHEFKATDFISPVQTDAPFKPFKTNVTFYPPSYAELYGPDCIFFKTLNACYDIDAVTLNKIITQVSLAAKSIF